VGVGEVARAALAAGLVQDLPEGGVVRQVDREALERALDGDVAVVADGTDVAAIHVAQGHGLDEVVDVGDGEGQVDALGALDGALALEVAHPAGEQHHLRDRQQGGRRRLVRVCFLLLVPRRGEGRPDRQQRRREQARGSGQPVRLAHGVRPPGRKGQSIPAARTLSGIVFSRDERGRVLVWYVWGMCGSVAASAAPPWTRSTPCSPPPRRSNATNRGPWWPWSAACSSWGGWRYSSAPTGSTATA